MEIIFTQLIFSESSYDIFDNPLIEINEQFALFPWVVVTIELASSFLSNISKSMYGRSSFAFKGENFANEFIKLVNNTGIVCCKISGNKGQKNDCDAVFILDNELYIVECKTIIQPYRFCKHISAQEKLVRASWQLNKNSELLLKNLDKVRVKFKLDSLWVPNQAHKIVLTNVKIGSSLRINNCYISDINTLILFFTKRGLGKRINGRPVTDSYSTPLELTSKNLLSELIYFRTLKIFENQVGLVNSTLNIAGHDINADFYVETQSSSGLMTVYE